MFVPGEPSCRSVVVDEDDLVVAACGAFLPELHDRRFWAYVEVAPTARGRLEVELDGWMVEVAAALDGQATSVIDEAVILGDPLD